MVLTTLVASVLTTLIFCYDILFYVKPQSATLSWIVCCIMDKLSGLFDIEIQ